ncbi:MAG: Hsp20/alpha crystallin family protein [Clostridiaceae bacterium]|nr:Hsp20/alpha crystallin family protein [Clostridiaceae bacterium]
MAGLVPFNRRNNSLRSGASDGFDSMLDDFFSDAWPFRRSLMADTFKIDVEDCEDHYQVEAELPGVEKRDIELSIDLGRLTIKVAQSRESEDMKKNYIHKERRYSSMSRSVYLADAISEGVKAKLDNGVLCIQVPKQKMDNNRSSITIE